MFCSNCGKTIRPEDDACRHCGASLGEGRFYGNTYTSSQVRLPVEALNEAPEGGMISYTRTSYMSYDNQPEDDVYSNTTYRPLLSDEEDLDLQEAEEAARAEAEAARQSEEAQAVEDEQDEFSEEAPAEEEPIEEEISDDEFSAEAPAEDVPADDEVRLTPEEINKAYPLEPLKKAAISPRVLSYMEELDRQEQRRASGGGLRMPSFLKKKAAPAYEEELPEAEDIVAAEVPAYEDESVLPDAEPETPDYAEEEYVPEIPAEETAEAYADDAEAYSEEDEAYAGEDVAAGEYVSDAEGDSFEYYEDADYAEDEEGAKPGFDFSRLKLNIDIKGLLANRTLQIAAAGVLIVAVITAGIIWLNFVTTKRAKIADVTYSAYSQGIELLQTHIGEEYRTTMQNVYLTNTSYANQTFAEDMAALDALRPEEPLNNDELFITTLTIIQDYIAEAIKADADAELNGASADYAADSELKWQAIGNAVNKLSEASNPGELPAILSDLENIVAPTPTPTIAPTETIYPTLTNGMMDNRDVKYMQNRLINLGFLDAEIPDGDFGNGTEAAVKAFQRAAGMTADGIATHEVQVAMYADDAPRTGTALLAVTQTPSPDATDAPDSQTGDNAAPQNPSAE